MGGLARFSVSLSRDLLRSFDGLMRLRRYSNRSEFVRDLLRAEMARGGWAAESGPGIGVLCLVYDHHTRNLTDKLNDIQHRGRGSVTASLHVHLDRHQCLEVIVLRGRPREILAISSQLIACRGVHRGELVPVAAGGAPHHHHHRHRDRRPGNGRRAAP